MTVARVIPRALVAGPAAAGAADAPGPLTMTTLSNGLRLVIRRNPARREVAACAAVGGGARVVAPGKAGLATLEAEMFLKGTRKRAADAVARGFEELGAGAAGDAYADYVTFSAGCLAEDFPRCFELFADCLTDATLPPDEFQQERDRLLSQVQSEDDDWETHGEKLMLAHLYPRHPYHYRVTGVPETVQDIGREDALAYYRKYVTPANTVVAVVGDVEPAAVAALAEKRLGKWRAEAAPAPVVPLDPPPSTEEDVRVATDNEQAVVYIGFRGCRYGEPDEFPLRMLDAALSGVYLPGGRLHNRLRDAGLVYVVHAYAVFGSDPGYFAVYAATAPANGDETLAIIREEMEKLKTAPVTADELARAKENWLTMEALNNRQTNASVAELAARDELVGLGFDWREGFADKIKAVTADDIMAAARKYLVNAVVVVTSPGVTTNGDGAGEGTAP
jgi:zinc protease